MVTFTEPVEESSIRSGKFTTNIGTVSGVVDDDTPDNAVIWVNLIDNQLLTDAIPTLSIEAGGIEDLAGNTNPTITDHASTDAAPPAILNAVAKDPDNAAGLQKNDMVVFTFSEPTNELNVDKDNIDIVFTLASHYWLDGGGAGSLGDEVSGGTEWDGTGTILTVYLDNGSTDPTVVPGDTITLSVRTASNPDEMITDIAGNYYSIPADDPAGVPSVPFVEITGTFGSDSASPTLSSVLTADDDHNGILDKLIVAFNEPVDPASIVPGYFTLDMGTVDTPDGVVDNGIDDDAIIWINLDESDPLATNTIPIVTLDTADAIADLSGNGNVADIFLQSTDNAPPVLLTAIATDAGGTPPGSIFNLNGDTLTLKFSEGLDITGLIASELESNLFFSPNDTSTNLPGSISISLATDINTNDSLVIQQNGATGSTTTLAVGSASSSVLVVANTNLSGADDGLGVLVFSPIDTFSVGGGRGSRPVPIVAATPRRAAPVRNTNQNDPARDVIMNTSSGGTLLYELLLFSDPFANQEPEPKRDVEFTDSIELQRSWTMQSTRTSSGIGNRSIQIDSPGRAADSTTGSASDDISGVETVVPVPRTNLPPTNGLTGVPGETKILPDTGWQYNSPESLDRPVTQNVDVVREFGPTNQTEESMVSTQAKAEEAIRKSEGTIAGKRELSIFIILSAIAFMSVVGYLIHRRRFLINRR